MQLFYQLIFSANYQTLLNVLQYIFIKIKFSPKSVLNNQNRQGAKKLSLRWHTSISVRKHLISLCNLKYWNNPSNIAKWDFHSSIFHNPNPPHPHQHHHYTHTLSTWGATPLYHSYSHKLTSETAKHQRILKEINRFWKNNQDIRITLSIFGNGNFILLNFQGQILLSWSDTPQYHSNGHNFVFGTGNNSFDRN